MNKKVMLSVAIILLAVAAVGGATMAWFTASVDVENTFTAGTLIIDAEDGWRGLEGQNWENANPGDCKEKDFTITNKGSKNMRVRFTFDGSWGDWVNGEWEVWGDGNPDLVTITPSPEFLADWVEVVDSENISWWYYVGTEHDPLAPEGELLFTFLVCLDGPGTGNEYQGKSFKIDFIFEAIQSSNFAPYYEWGVDLYGVPTE